MEHREEDKGECWLVSSTLSKVGCMFRGDTKRSDNPGGVSRFVAQIASIPLSIVQSATKVDVVTDMEVMKHAPPPSQQEWNRKARKFCRRFPGHPNCRLDSSTQ